MIASKPILLMTRPEDASHRFVASLPNQIVDDLDVVIAPLMKIVPLSPVRSVPQAGSVIFTSGNAVEILGGPKIRNQRAFCVGRSTTAFATQAGWEATFMGETAEALVLALKSAGHEGPLIHVGGRHVRVDIADHLRRAGMNCEYRAVYDQELQALTPQARAALRGGVPIISPLFSPRTARQFADEVTTWDNVTAVVLSEAVAEPLKTRGLAEIVQAARPDAAAMVDAVSFVAGQLSRVEGGSGPH